MKNFPAIRPQTGQGKEDTHNKGQDRSQPGSGHNRYDVRQQVGNPKLKNQSKGEPGHHLLAARNAEADHDQPAADGPNKGPGE